CIGHCHCHSQAAQSAAWKPSVRVYYAEPPIYFQSSMSVNSGAGVCGLVTLHFFVSNLMIPKRDTNFWKYIHGCRTSLPSRHLWWRTMCRCIIS
ncbi:hypothetical protein EI94DRAFT_1746281, partial [Lactarius quietus]